MYGNCGSVYAGESGTGRTGSKYHYYKCVKAKKFDNCNKKAIKKDPVEKTIFDTIVKYVFVDEVIEESKPVRKGLTQIRDWQCWIDNNKEYFFRSCGRGEIAKCIPSWGIWYCLVVSRRAYMDDCANSIRRLIMNNYRGLKIISYDRLVDNVKRLVNGF